MINEKVLFVDDEPSLLAAMARSLHGVFDIKTATSGNEALAMLRETGPFAVVVSDLRMPEMDGTAFLSTVKKLAPDTVRIMLSGTTDLDEALEAVNCGQVFRFLTKPCSANALVTTLTLAVRHYNLVVGERDLLSKTLKGSINLLSELLSLSNPTAFSRGHRISRAVSTVAARLGAQPLWQFEVAALLSQVGCIAVPSDILAKAYIGAELTDNERKIFHNHPLIGSRLVRRIPRMETVAAMIAGQMNDFDDRYHNKSETTDAVVGAQLLRIMLDYDLLRNQGMTHEQATEQLFARHERYDPTILALLPSIDLPQPSGAIRKTVLFDDIVPGMIAAEDIRSGNGNLIISNGQEITWSMIQGLQNFIDHMAVQEPFQVWLPE
ncbi:response regulator [bacterium]|nr:response regulator [bacterium]